jgi:hypothetical protein
MVLESEMKRTHLLLNNNLNMQKLTILSLCILLLAACSGAKKSSSAASTPTSSISEKVKACKKNEGLFTLYQDTVNGSLYMLLKKEQLEKDVATLELEIKNLEETSIIKIWEDELNELLKEWIKYKTDILEDYENDLKGDLKKIKKSGKK